LSIIFKEEKMKKIVLILVFGFFIISGCGYKVRFLPRYNYNNYKPNAGVEQSESKTRMSMSIWTGIPVAKWEKEK